MTISCIYFVNIALQGCSNLTGELVGLVITLYPVFYFKNLIYTAAQKDVIKSYPTRLQQCSCKQQIIDRIHQAV